MNEGGTAVENVVSGDNLREAQRFALLIRTAKLVCSSGEYLCIVRDISASGVRLRLFHDLPSADGLALQLANGYTYPLECVWQREDHAGFRFTGEIDVHEFMEEPSKWPRRPIRLHFRIPAMVIADDLTSQTVVHNISRYGARIESERYLALQQKIILDIQGAARINASICWRSGRLYGLVFRQTFTFEELAKLAAVLQPFDGSAVATPTLRKVHG
jgi:hypothetical protein